MTETDIGSIEGPEKPRYGKWIDTGRFVIEESPEEKEKVPKGEEKVRPRSIEMTVTQDEVEKKEVDRSRYFKDLDVGRIVIEEIPEEKKEESRVSKKEKVRPRSTEVILTGQGFGVLPSESVKENAVKVGKLDVTDFEKHSVKYRTVEETKRRYKNWTHMHETKEEPLSTTGDVVQKDEPKKPRHMVLEEVHKEKEDVPKREILRKQQIRPKSTEVTLTQHEVKTHREVRSGYAKGLDVGRIVVEDIPEERRDMPRAPKKQKARPKSIEVTLTGQEVEEIPRECSKENVVKVGKLDVTDFEKQSWQSSTVQERIRTYKDWTYQPEKTDHTKEKVEITTSDETQTDKPEKPVKPRYSKDSEVGRIVIDEFPADKQELPKREVLKKEQVGLKTTDVTVTQYEVKDEREKYDVGRIMIEEIPDEREGPAKRDVLRKDEEPYTTEVTVTHDEVREQSEVRPRYAKDLDVGRIVIEESPEEKKDIPRAPKKEKARPKSIEVTLTGQEVEEIPRKRSKEDVIKVGKLDVTDFEKQSWQSSTVQERIRTYKDWTHQHDAKAKVRNLDMILSNNQYSKTSSMSSIFITK